MSVRPAGREMGDRSLLREDWFSASASVCLLQVVILNGRSAVFSALAMVLCDPGGKSAGSALLRDTAPRGQARMGPGP